MSGAVLEGVIQYPKSAAAGQGQEKEQKHAPRRPLHFFVSVSYNPRLRLAYL